MRNTKGQSDQKIKVWKVEVFGSWVIFKSLPDLLDSLKCDLEEITDPEEIIISPVWMYEYEFNKLPEFEGY